MAEIVFTQSEIIEVRAAFGARLRELDKGFKACIKAGVKEAAEKIAESVTKIRSMDGTLKDLQEEQN